MAKKARKNKDESGFGDVSVKQALIALETKSNRALNSLDRSCESLRELETDLEAFLNEYYDRVGGYFEQLESLDSELETFKASVSAQQMPIAKRIYDKMEVMPKKNTESLDKNVRTLYRDLVKECHPDTAAGVDAVEQMKDDAIRTLNDAYSRKDLGGLWKMKFKMEVNKAGSVEQMDPRMQIDMLQERVQQMQKSLDDVEQRRLKLEESPACALMQRAFQMRLCGQDFIEMVVEDVKHQIERKRKELVSTKVRHLYMEAKEIRDNTPESSD